MAHANDQRSYTTVWNNFIEYTTEIVWGTKFKIKLY